MKSAFESKHNLIFLKIQNNKFNINFKSWKKKSNLKIWLMMNSCMPEGICYGTRKQSR